MTIKSATPYLILNGRAREGIDFYVRSLGATAESVMRFGDLDGSCPVPQRDKVMHAVLRVGEAVVFLSDGGSDGGPAQGAGCVNVALDFTDVEELRRVFDALAVEGSVHLPVGEAPWGAWFGAVTDRYGVSWMLNSTKAS